MSGSKVVVSDQIDGDDREIIRAAATCLQAGGIVALPTDTVYGLAAILEQPRAIERLYALKGRSASKAIPILLGDVSRTRLVAEGLTREGRVLAQRFWPGALSIVVRARAGLPLGVTAKTSAGKPTVALRVPDLLLTRRIIEAVGGSLAVTSANRSGQPPALDASELEALELGEKSLIVDGGRVSGGVASTVVDATGPLVEILREGAIAISSLESALAGLPGATVALRPSAV